MKLHYIIIGIIIVSSLTLGFINFSTELSDRYSTSVDLTGLDGTQARLETQQEIAQELEGKMSFELKGSPSDVFEVPYVMIQVAWQSAKLMFNSWFTVGTMITETGEGLEDSGIPLPSWILPTLIALVVIILGAIIIYAFFKWRFEDK